RAKAAGCGSSRSSIRSRPSGSSAAERAKKMIPETLRNPLSLFDVRDTVVIITGASGSFGRACAVALGPLGAHLVLASGSGEELDEVAAEVREVGGKVVAVERRPDSLADAETILTAGREAFGKVDRLVGASGT